jgi:replicative DNA helicase
MDNARIFSPTAEQALLAAIIRHPDKYTAQADLVKSTDFGWHAFGWIWSAMGRLIDKGMRIDSIVIGDELERAGQLAEFCLPSGTFHGRAALSQLRDIETTEAVESYSLIVQDYSGKRFIDEKLTEAHNWAHNGRTASSIIADLQTSFGSLMLQSGKTMTHTSTSKQAGERAIELSRAASRGERAMTTGLPKLDLLLYPQRGELITIAAQTGKGKSSLLATIALNSAKSGKRVKLFSLEMSGPQVAQRLLAQISGISASRIMQGQLDKDEWQQIDEANELFQDLNISICDLSAIKIGQIRTESRRSPVDIIMVDYIQLANADKPKENRVLDIGEVTRGLKSLAMELDIPIFAAAQLSRAVDSRGDKRPVLSDLRESGSIEQDSDSVVFIWQDPIKETSHELIVAKHRNGACNKLEVHFNPSTTRFAGIIPEQEINEYSN